MEQKIKNELGIYVHIPFCKKKCDYCDFISFDKIRCKDESRNLKNEIEEYIKKVILEIKKFDFSNYRVTTIYIGGGTPSYIDEKYIEEIMRVLKDKITNESKASDLKKIESTIEINPGTVNNKKLKKYYEIGINRVSIGLQTVNDNLLKQIGRIHTYREFEEVYNMAVDTGFKNINFDLIIGLPNQTIEDISKTVDIVKKLNPNHVSIYSLIVEKETKLYQNIVSGKLKELDEEVERYMYWYLKNKLETLGYNHYEISNFAKKGKESKHNINCWKQKEYIGFGLGAHSYIDKVRFCNSLNNENDISYIKEIQEVQNVLDMQKEYMLLGLRMLKGVSISNFKEKFINNPIYVFKDELDYLVNKKLITIDGDYIKLSHKGLDFANLVWEEFI